MKALILPRNFSRNFAGCANIIGSKRRFPAILRDFPVTRDGNGKSCQNGSRAELGGRPASPEHGVAHALGARLNSMIISSTITITTTMMIITMATMITDKALNAILEKIGI